MPSWDNVAGLMCFKRLDGARDLEAAFTLAYRVTDNDTDVWTRRLNKFKGKDKEAVAGAITTLGTALPDLFSALRLDPSRTLFVPALSSGEQTASEGGLLPVVARVLSRKIKASSDHTILKKKAHTSIHNLRSAAEREAELDKAEYVALKACGPIVVIVDDFITRGSTMQRISDAIKKHDSRTAIYGLALGKTDRISWLSGLKNGVANDFVPEKWNEEWKNGVQLYRERMGGG